MIEAPTLNGSFMLAYEGTGVRVKPSDGWQATVNRTREQRYGSSDTAGSRLMHLGAALAGAVAVNTGTVAFELTDFQQAAQPPLADGEMQFIRAGMRQVFQTLGLQGVII
jgi:hypothetical protein